MGFNSGFKGLIILKWKLVASDLN